MRIVRGEPERGDDRGTLVRCRVTQRDEAWSNHTSMPAGRRIATMSNVRPPVCWRSFSLPSAVRVNRTACAATVPWPQPDSSAVAVKNRTGQPPSGVRR
jgi:hypothetical protein